ncbi:MAG: hypothetical protein AABP62_11985 [Planctomycetota bacterium]
MPRLAICERMFRGFTVVLGKNHGPAVLFVDLPKYLVAQIGDGMFRVVVSRLREMNHVRIDIEPQPLFDEPTCAALAADLSKAIKQRLQFHAEITLAPSGSPPRFEMKAKRLVRE